MFKLTSNDDGESIDRKFSAANAEIARLKAEVERLTGELTASCARAELQQREAERLRRNNGVLHDTIEKIFEEGAKQLGRAETARNDALEEAALECGHHLSTEDDVILANDIAERIRALKETK